MVLVLHTQQVTQCYKTQNTIPHVCVCVCECDTLSHPFQLIILPLPLDKWPPTRCLCGTSSTWCLEREGGRCDVTSTEPVSCGASRRRSLRHCWTKSGHMQSLSATVRWVLVLQTNRKYCLHNNYSFISPLAPSYVWHTYTVCINLSSYFCHSVRNACNVYPLCSNVFFSLTSSNFEISPFS